MSSRMQVNGNWITIDKMFKDGETNRHTCLMPDGTFKGLDGKLTTNPDILKIVPPPYDKAAMAQAIYNGTVAVAVAEPTALVAPPIVTTQAAFACPTCGKVAKSKAGLFVHQRSHRVAVA